MTTAQLRTAARSAAAALNWAEAADLMERAVSAYPITTTPSLAALDIARMKELAASYKAMASAH